MEWEPSDTGGSCCKHRPVALFQTNPSWGVKATGESFGDGLRVQHSMEQPGFEDHLLTRLLKDNPKECNSERKRQLLRNALRCNVDKTNVTADGQFRIPYLLVCTDDYSTLSVAGTYIEEEYKYSERFLNSPYPRQAAI